MNGDLRNSPIWQCVIELHRQGVSLDRVSKALRIPAEEIARAIGTWTGVECKRPKVAKDGTTICPRCAKEAWPVRFGMWIPERDKPAPKAVMAGCVIGPDAPEWACQNDGCGYNWRVDTHSTTGIPDRLALMQLRHEGLSLEDIAELYDVELTAVNAALHDSPGLEHGQ
ncbi:hypothetical protein D477_004496 [Arthrobacter crystallopoietes BAB-32]|uniref:Uncharacterized protein n=1 Tax=Arthrobacter crystallopoietes BAB-32 TaxID=1246476 RepID=N1UYE5_9MICC|nr:hypothetical protein [Arthrobacter crystallopoietes]EMY35406.1 hypothetical protein D477_004496 [Arthrobacter crystallopoietes BAB-32]